MNLDRELGTGFWLYFWKTGAILGFLLTIGGIATFFDPDNIGANIGGPYLIILGAGLAALSIDTINSIKRKSQK